MKVSIARVAAGGLALAALAFAPAPRPPASYQRSIAPFPVSDSAGLAWPMPFLGGFDSPRPSLVVVAERGAVMVGMSPA